MSGPRKIRIGGEVFPSGRAAAQALGLASSTITRMVERGEAVYVDGQGVKSHLEVRRARLMRARESYARALRKQVRELFDAAHVEGWL